MSVRRTLAAALAAGLLLAGCSDEPEPRFAPTESPSPSESETSAEPEAQTPEAFIREWFEAGTAMQNTGQTDEFLAYSERCEPCTTFADDVEDVYAAGGFIQIDFERVTRVTELSKQQFEVEVRAAPTKFRESEGAEVGSFPGGTNTYLLSLVEREEGWAITNYLDNA